MRIRYLARRKLQTAVLLTCALFSACGRFCNRHPHIATASLAEQSDSAEVVIVGTVTQVQPTGCRRAVSWPKAFVTEAVRLEVEPHYILRGSVERRPVIVFYFRLDRSSGYSGPPTRDPLRGRSYVVFAGRDGDVIRLVSDGYASVIELPTADVSGIQEPITVRRAVAELLLQPTPDDSQSYESAVLGGLATAVEFAGYTETSRILHRILNGVSAKKREAVLKALDRLKITSRE